MISFFFQIDQGAQSVAIATTVQAPEVYTSS